MHRVVAELRAELLKSEAVLIGVNAGGVDLIPRQKLIADLVGGVGKLNDQLARRAREGAEHYREPVSAQNREHQTDDSVAELGADVGSDLIAGRVVALRSRDDRFGHAYDVAVVKLEALFGGRLDDARRYAGDKVVTLLENGGYYSS